MTLFAFIFAAFLAPRSGAVSLRTDATGKLPAVDNNTKASATDAFGKLPLSFEPNQGQVDSQVLFVARSQGYGLFLTANGAVFSFNGLPDPVRMQLLGAAATPRVSGVDQLPGKVNYLKGNQAGQWRTNISTYKRVRYEQIYSGVDLVYYGNQRQLEYDFVVEPQTSVKQIRLAFDGAGKLKLNRRGDLILKNGARQITLLRPRAYQEIDGTERSVECRYKLNANGEVSFTVGRYDRNHPLVIDPVLAYSTFLGGSDQDLGQAIAVDADGNAYITGTTDSLNFPTSSPMQPANGAGADVFVAKINATGSALVYSTYLGGANIDSGNGIAVDASGNAYVVGQTFSTDFPLHNPIFSALFGATDAFVAELNPSGSALVYSTYIGGHSSDSASAVAVDALGNAYVTGQTFSPDMPGIRAFQGHRAGNAIFKTPNAAALWGASDDGLLAANASDLVFDPVNSSIIYAATDSGIFKSTNAGLSWLQLNGKTALPVNRLVIDPSNSNIIYAATSSGMYKSTDGGSSFNALAGFPTFARTVVIDPVTPTTLYATSTGNVVFKSINGGINWTQSFLNSVSSINGLLIDPNNPSTVYAATNRGGVVKSTNSGGTWAPSNTGLPSFSNVNTVAIDKTNNILYAGTGTGVFKSVNGGDNWTNINGNLPSISISLVTPDPSNPQVIYIANSGTVQKTVNGGAIWSLSNTGLPGTTVNSLIMDPAQPATLYVGTSSGADAFVTKIDAGGATQSYATYLGGSLGDGGNSIAIDASGNAYVAGSTNSPDFPTANALQPAKAALTDAFVAKITENGPLLVLSYSTFLGGDGAESGRAIAVDGSGNMYVAGSTSSQNFPTANAFQPANASATFFNDAFLSKINAAGSAFVYSTYLGGTDNDDAFGVALDAAGNAYVAGATSSTNFPIKGAIQPALNGTGSTSDAFITKFAPSGAAIVYSTYLGGSSVEGAAGIAVDSSQNAYIVGSTSSANFPTANALQPSYGGGTREAFVAKLRPAPELALTMTDSPDPVNFGADLTYTINVTNNGELPATNVVVTDTLPAGSTFVSANSTAGSCTGTSSITCTLGKLNAAASATITIVVKPAAVRTMTNTASVTLAETDSFLGNNTASVDTLVDFADLTITKIAAQSLVAPGSKLTYSLIVKNKGVLTAAVTVIDNLPAGTTLSNCSATAGVTCGGSGNNVSVLFPALAPNTSQAILLSANVSGATIPGTVISNTATVSSPLPDPDTSNNSATATATVATVPVLPKSNGRIAYAADRAFTPVSEPSGIYSVKPDGTDEQLFPNIPLNAGLPSWSPDGTKLAFQYRNFAGLSSPVNEIYIINADGSSSTKLVENISDFNHNITWSPNGSQIAYISSGVQGNIATIRTINIANTDGSGSYVLPNSPTFLSTVDWSPDGTKFVYATDNEIFLMNADGTGQTQLTTQQQTDDGATTDSVPHWSPDGAKIVFTRSTNNFRSIYTMNANGSNVAKIFNFNALEADWAPDGQSLVFQSGNEICTASLDGSNFKCVTNNIYYEFTPNWQQLPNASPTPTPTPAPTFSVAGHVSLSDGSPFTFMQVRISGPTSAEVLTNTSGDYSFVNLPAGDYTLTPISVSHSFNPSTRNVTITNANLTGMDFVATFVPANITGHVRDNNGNPLAGIKITSVGGFPEGITFTDANGFYSFQNVARRRTYSISPDPFTAYEFAPNAQILSDLTTSQVVDFVGTKQPANIISGRVIEAVTGQGIGGIQIDLGQDFAAAATTFTDGNGNFSFGERKSNHSYSVSISFNQTFIFAPTVNAPTPFAQYQIASLTSNQNLIFNGTRRNTVQFAVAASSVAENAGFHQLVVTRSGDVASPAQVNYATSDTAGLAACSVVNGAASERCDYETAAGTLRFAAGETSKSFVVPIVNDAHNEGNETFTVTLSGPLGAATNSPATATVTINDDDATPSAQNPIDGVEFFVTQQYIDFLGRLPDSVGLANWMATLNGCPNGGFGENDNPDCDRVHVSSGFFLSDEFRGRGYWAYRFYEVGFDRRPLYAEFTPDMAQVGGPQSPSSELLSKSAYTDAFVQRSEFVNRYNGLTNAAYVNALEQNAEITLANKATLITALDNNQTTRAQVLRDIVESKEVEDRFFIRAFVAMQYFGYLRRDPDTVGYNNWVTTLTADPNNVRHMIFGFLFSTEYRGRFGVQ